MSVGRGVWSRKTCVEDCLSIDVSMLARNGRLKTKGFIVLTRKRKLRDNTLILIRVAPPDELRLMHKLTNHRTGESRDITQWVFLEFTDCSFGGERPWFICPNCERRCRMIYFAGGSDWFVCRVCSKLTYRSQQEYKGPLVCAIKAVVEYDGVRRQYFRTRSPRIKAKLRGKLDRMESILSGAVRSLDK